MQWLRSWFELGIKSGAKINYLYFIIQSKVLFIRKNGRERVLSLSIEIEDDNDMAPRFLTDFSQKSFKLCQKSLQNGLNADVFLATDQDKGF